MWAMTVRTKQDRDRGLRRVKDLTRWTVAGALAGTGLFAGLAAQAHAGSTKSTAVKTTTTPTTQAAASTDDSSSDTASSDDGTVATPPASTPDTQATLQPTQVSPGFSSNNAPSAVSGAS